MNKWKPITKEELEAEIKEQLLVCAEEQKNLYSSYQVPFKKYKIMRYGNLEEVYVVAMNENEAMYYEDVEEGFNFSTINNGVLTEPGCEQDELKYALLHWK